MVFGLAQVVSRALNASAQGCAPVRKRASDAGQCSRNGLWRTRSLPPAASPSDVPARFKMRSGSIGYLIECGNLRVPPSPFLLCPLTRLFPRVAADRATRTARSIGLNTWKRDVLRHHYVKTIRGSNGYSGQWRRRRSGLSRRRCLLRRFQWPGMRRRPTRRSAGTSRSAAQRLGLTPGGRSRCRRIIWLFFGLRSTAFGGTAQKQECQRNDGLAHPGRARVDGRRS
jgi:hypothetical protein